MTTIRRGAVELELPDNVSVIEEQPRRRGRGAPVDVGPTDPVSPEAVAAAFADQLTTVDTVTLNVGPAGPRRRGEPTAPPLLRVDVGADEQAVLLVEQDGYYTWVTGTKEVPRTSRRGPSSAVVTFEIPYAGAAVGGSGRRGPIGDFLVKPVTTFVFRFLARLAIGEAVKRMERSIEPRLVRIDQPDPTSWTAPPAAGLPTGRRARLLLLIHGTFSSTRGGFGSFVGIEEGKRFLNEAIAHYDEVIGFDHRTLSEDPLENAKQLAGLLRGLKAESGIDVDVVTHSRGALVVRSLVEQVLEPGDDVTVSKAIMVAGPNGGTLLAHPENWDALIDLYTNLAVAACRVVAFAAPPAATVTTILKESLQALAILVKAIVAEAADEVRVPGLGAMVPGGAFITALNVSTPARPTSAAYYAVSSNFEVGPVATPTSLPAKLVSRLADGLVDRLMGEDNDLVVNVASMTAVDSPDLIRGAFKLDDDPRTHHCAYFVNEPVVRSLRHWLLGPGGSVLPPDDSPPIGETVYSLPAAVDSNFVVIDADTPLAVAKRQVRSSRRKFAVVRSRSASGELEHYAFTPDEFISLSDGATVEAMVGPTGMLAGAQSSPVTRSTHAIPPRPLNVENPWASRTVVLLDGSPIGIAGARTDTLAEGPPARPPRRTRGGNAPAVVVPPPTPTATPSVAQAYFRAETDAVISTATESLVLVDISLEALTGGSDPSVGTDLADIHTDKSITVHVVPRINLTVIGDKHVTVDPPTVGDPRSLRFSIIGASPGPGQLLVIAGQGPVDLVKIVLDVTVADDASVAPVPVSVTAALPPMPDVTATDRLIIDENTIVALSPGEPHTETVVQTRFDVRYESEALDVVERGQTAPISGDRLAYVTDLYRQIEADWGGSNADAKRFNRALRAFGGQLFDELLPESIQRQLWDNRDKIKHIQVNSIDPLIPWEIVHLKGPGQALPCEELFLANLGLVRWIDGARYAPREVTVARGRVSAIAPAYPPESGWTLPETVAELNYLKTTFNATEVATDVEAVMSLLERPGQFDLLHFAGHGEAANNDIANAGLILQVRHEGNSWAPVQLTSTMVEQFANLRDGNGNRPLVFLNACQAGRAGHQLTQVGGFAQAFLKGGAGIFVSTLWSVMDTPAREFGEEFYAQLIAGKTVAQAAVAARQATRALDDPTWLAYVVYGRPDGRLVLS
jgi:hypothetical protein